MGGRVRGARHGGARLWRGADGEAVPRRGAPGRSAGAVAGALLVAPTLPAGGVVELGHGEGRAPDRAVRQEAVPREAVALVDHLVHVEQVGPGILVVPALPEAMFWMVK